MNPEFRQTLNTIRRDLESANEAAQERIYTFTELYIDPCLSGFKACLHDCTAPCFPNRDDQLRRRRGRSRGRAELNFDFYDDWEEDEDAGNSLMGWGNDELDSLLAGNRKGRDGQPGRQRAMSYGSRGRRRANTLPHDQGQDPTVIPGSSYLGFLERLPWKLGSRVLKYQPSAADLQVNPRGLRLRDEGSGPLSEEDVSAERTGKQGHQRKRSGTANSRSTTNSLSSRGDLIMSDEEEDAVPLDDEFAVMLSKRTTNSEDHSSGKTGSNGKRPRTSRASTRTVSSKSVRSTPKSAWSGSRRGSDPIVGVVPETPQAPTMLDLRRQENQLREEQEMEIEQKREAAQKLALGSGLTTPASESAAVAEELKHEPEIQPEDPTVISLPMREAEPVSGDSDRFTQYHRIDSSNNSQSTTPEEPP